MPKPHQQLGFESEWASFAFLAVPLCPRTILSVTIPSGSTMWTPSRYALSFVSETASEHQDTAAGLSVDIASASVLTSAAWVLQQRCPPASCR